MKQKFKDTKVSIKSEVAHPKLDTVKVTPMGGLIAEMKQANAEAVRELNREQNPPRCHINCPCGPCRAGECRYCTRDAERRREADARYERRYDEPYRGGFAADERIPPGYPGSDRYPDRYRSRALSDEWRRMGGIWDAQYDQPVLRDEGEYLRFKELERYADDRNMYGRERERQYERESRRTLEMNMNRMSFNNTPDFILKNGDIWILPEEKGGKGGKNE